MNSAKQVAINVTQNKISQTGIPKVKKPEKCLCMLHGEKMLTFHDKIFDSLKEFSINPPATTSTHKKFT